MCAIGGGKLAPSRTTHMWPNVRWSVKRRSGPSSENVNQIRTCGTSGRSGSPTSSCPLMPRCASSASSPTDSHRYLPRRMAASRLRPASAASNSAGPSTCRRTARGCSTRTVFDRPADDVALQALADGFHLGVAQASRLTPPGRSPPLLPLSSGLSSSGLSSVLWLVLSPALPTSPACGAGWAAWGGLGGGCLGGDRGPGHLGRLLFGRLLGAPLTGAEHPAADPDRGTERLLVVRPALLDLVFKHAEKLARGQLLQRRLPVQAGPAGPTCR